MYKKNKKLVKKYVKCKNKWAILHNPADKNIQKKFEWYYNSLVVFDLVSLLVI